MEKIETYMLETLLKQILYVLAYVLSLEQMHKKLNGGLET